MSVPGSPGESEGQQPLCLGKSPEKTLPKGFLWATSSRRLDTALLCAAKKRGVEKNQLAGLCQSLPWFPDHRSGSKKYLDLFTNYL